MMTDNEDDNWRVFVDKYWLNMMDHDGWIDG